MPRLIGRDGRLRIRLLLGGLLAAVAALALVAFFLFPRPGTTPRDVASPAVSGGAEPSSSEILEGSYDPAPTGCLGGQARDTAMVLATQKKAGHSTFGAVEVAASVFRWGLRYPYPAAAQIKAMRPVLAEKGATKQEAAWASEYASAGYRKPPGDSVPSGTPYYLTTANGMWVVDGSSTKDQVVVDVAAHYVIDDAYSVATSTLRVDLQWSERGWQVASLGRADARRLTSGGTSFTSGC